MSYLPNITNLVKQFGQQINNKKTKKVSEPQKFQVTQPQYDINVRIREYRNQQRKALQKFEWTSKATLTPKQLQIRQNAFKWLLTKCLAAFQLKHRTLELTMKLFDIYQCKVAQGCQYILPQRQQLVLDLVTILYISSKYQEIYPPELSDFIAVIENEGHQRFRFIQNQKNIFETLQFSLNFTTVSDWYQFIEGKKMPYWAFYCYIGYEMSQTSQVIANDIIYFIKQFKKSGDKQLRNIVDSLIGSMSMSDIFLSRFLVFRTKKLQPNQEKAAKTKRTIWK